MSLSSLFKSIGDTLKSATSNTFTVKGSTPAPTTVTPVTPVATVTPPKITPIAQIPKSLNEFIARKNVGTLIGGYDFANYATSPDHIPAVKKIYSETPLMLSASDVQMEINRAMKVVDQTGRIKSPITGQMVWKAAEKYKVNPAIMIAEMRKDSTLGTQGIAVETKNPGNVGNNDLGNKVYYKTWDEGVDALAQFLSTKKVGLEQMKTPSIITRPPLSIGQQPTQPEKVTVSGNVGFKEIGDVLKRTGQSAVKEVEQGFFTLLRMATDPFNDERTPREVISAQYEKMGQKNLIGTPNFERNVKSYEEYTNSKVGKVSTGIADFLKKEVTKPASDFAVKNIKDIELKQEEILKPLFDDKPGLSNWKEYLSTITSGAISIGEAVGLTLITKNTAVGAAFLSALEATSEYNQALDSGASREAALKTSVLSGAGTYIMEKVGLDFIFGKFGGSRIAKAFLTSGLETGQELVQTFWQNLVRKYGYNKAQNVFEGTWETVVGTAIPSFIVGFLVPGFSLSEQRDKLITKLQREGGLTEEEAKKTAEQMIETAKKEEQKFTQQKQPVPVGLTIREQTEQTWTEFEAQRKEVLSKLPKETEVTTLKPKNAQTIEPQVREAVNRLNELGYETGSSGFVGVDSMLAKANNNMPTHSIDGTLGLTKEQIDAINASGLGRAVQMDGFAPGYQAILVKGNNNLRVVQNAFNSIVDIIEKSERIQAEVPEMKKAEQALVIPENAKIVPAREGKRETEFNAPNTWNIQWTDNSGAIHVLTNFQSKEAAQRRIEQSGRVVIKVPYSRTEELRKDIKKAEKRIAVASESGAPTEDLKTGLAEMKNKLKQAETKATKKKGETASDKEIYNYIDNKETKLRTSSEDDRTNELILSMPDRLTSKFLEHSDTRDKEYASYEFLYNLSKSDSFGLKQIEREIVQGVLEYPEFKNNSKINMKDFRHAVIGQLLRLDILETRQWSEYGSENVGLDVLDKTTYVLNSPFEHGYTGHFDSLYSNTVINPDGIIIREIPVGPNNPTAKFAVVRKDVTLTAENIEENVFNVTNTKESAEAWVKDFTKGVQRGPIEIKKGMFSWIRTFDNSESGVSHVAEIQSDPFQKPENMKTIQGQKIKLKENVEYFDNRVKSDEELIYSKKEQLEKISNLINFVQSDLLQKENLYKKPETNPFTFEDRATKRVDKLVEKYNIDADYLRRMWSWYSDDIFNPVLEIKNYVDYLQSKSSGIQDDVESTERDLESSRLSLKSNQEDLAKITDVPTQLEKAFMSYRNIWQERSIREIVAIKAREGRKFLRFPTPRTIAAIEGYMGGVGEDAEYMPYEVIEGSQDGPLVAGDVVDYGGIKMTVLNVDGDAITVAPSDTVRDFNANDAMYEDIANQWDEGVSEFERLQKDVGKIEYGADAERALNDLRVYDAQILFMRKKKDIADENRHLKNDSNIKWSIEKIKGLKETIKNYNKFIKLLNKGVIEKEGITKENIHDMRFKDKLEKKYGLDHGYWNILINALEHHPRSTKLAIKEAITEVSAGIDSEQTRINRERNDLTVRIKDAKARIKLIESRKAPSAEELTALPKKLKQGLLDAKKNKNIYTYNLNFITEKILDRLAESESGEKLDIEDYRDGMTTALSEDYNADYEGMYGKGNVFYDSEDGHVWITEGTAEDLMQPDQYAQRKSIDDFRIDDFSGNTRTVLLFYDKQVIPYLKKFRKDNLYLATDGNDFEWYETKLTPDDKNAPTAYRLKDDLEKIGIKITEQQEKELLDLNMEIFGDADIKIAEQILANQKALASYKSSIIKILDGQADPKSSFYHEAVHKYLDIFTNRSEYADVLREGQRVYQLENLGDVEERIAEDFIKYAKSRTGVMGKIRTFFDKILIRIERYLGNDNKIEQLYNDILSGKARKTKGNAGMAILQRLGIRQKPNIIERREDVLLRSRVRAMAKATRKGISIGRTAARIRTIEKFTKANIQIEEARKNVEDYIRETLEPQDRGKFLATLRQARTVTDVAKAFARIDSYAEKQELKGAIKALSTKAEKLADSPSVSAEYRNMIKAILDQYELTGHTKETIAKLKATQQYLDREKAAGELVALPQDVLNKLKILSRTPKDQLTMNQVNTIGQEIEMLGQLGKVKWEAKQALYAAQREYKKQLLLQTASPTDSRKIVLENIEDVPSVWTKKMINARNWLQKTRVGLTPIDGLGEITGVTPMVDDLMARYGNYLEYNDKDIIDWYKITEGLTEGQLQRVGAVMLSQRPGGYARLANTGWSKEKLDAIVLTPNEQAAAAMARKLFDKHYPEVKKYMLDNYNITVDDAKSYVSFHGDYDALNELELFDRFGRRADDAVMNTKTVEQGFTKATVEGSKINLELNIDKILRRHLDDVAYMLSIGKDVKQYFEVINSPEMRAKLGDVGSLAWLQWLDVMARKGGSSGAKRIAALDIVRKNLGAGVLAFRISSAMVQFSSFADTIATIGPGWATKGAFNITNSKEWRSFIMDNFPEIRKSVGDDIAFREFDNAWLGKGAAKATAIGMKPLQFLDGLMRSFAAAGSYEKIASEAGEQVDLKNPNPKFIQEANKLMNQSQGSSYFPRQPLALTAGFGLLNNRSLNKTFLTFQSFMLNRWENFKRQFWRMGIQQKDYKKAISAFFWLAIFAGALEESLRRVTRWGLGLVTGNIKEEKAFITSVLLQTAQSIPILGQIISAMWYSSNPVPVFNAAEDALQGGRNLIVGAKPSTKLKGLTQFSGSLGSLLGIAGSSQLFQAIGQAIPPANAPKKSPFPGLPELPKLPSLPSLPKLPKL